MNPNLIKKLQDFFQTNPITKGEPSTAEELLLVEQTMQLKLDETHRYLLLHYGGVVIGDIRIYGLKNTELIGDETFVELTDDFREQMSIEAQQYVISVDDMGNPILVDTATREVILYNHDIGAYEKLFNSLEDLILSKLVDSNNYTRMNLLIKNIKRNGYIVVICYIILVCFYNIFNYIRKPGMPELHSFSWEGIQALVETFAVPIMLLFESYRHGDWVLNTLNKLLTIAPLLFYIVVPSILYNQEGENRLLGRLSVRSYFLVIDSITFVIYGLLALPTLGIGLSGVISYPLYAFMLFLKKR